MTFIRKGALVCGIAVAAIVTGYGPRFLPESSPVSRGTESARLFGCIECHGQTGTAYPDDLTLSCSDNGPKSTHDAYAGRCSDLLAYFEVVRLKRTFGTRVLSASPNRLLAGERLARQYNCFQCHGELGQGGFRNAGALKGYVPGYFGRDFALLTRGRRAESVKAWITQGIDPDLLASPIEGAVAKYFIDRQAVSMPNFGSLPDASVQVLTDYVITLNQLGPMSAKEIRGYSELTQQPGNELVETSAAIHPPRSGPMGLHANARSVSARRTPR